MAGAALGAVPAMLKAFMSGAKGWASPVKSSSLTKPPFKRRECKVPRYETPSQSEFTDKELAELLCNKCWANNDLKGCWYPVGALPCFQCTAQQRPCTLDSTKTCEQGDTPDPVVERTYHQAVLVRRVWDIVEKAREAEASATIVTIDRWSLALLMCQDKESRESGKGKHKASPPLSPTEKRKKRACVVSPAAVTPEVELEDKEEGDKEVCSLATAIEVNKAAPSSGDLVGPSHQPEASQDLGAQKEDSGQGDKRDKEDELEPQPWDSNPPQTTPTTALGPDCYPANPLGSP
ncbi:hypothetical protein C0993_001958 [Termitomyces sp. T159_Od127]|nr:hypothetical protein C0993_001958 [Termitomyces sp. T159_Od127]